MLPLEKRLNYTSLKKYAKTNPEFKEYDERDLDYDSNIRNQIRGKCHLEIYGDFMKMLE